MITIEGLTKQYGRHNAIQNLNFTIAKGEIVGFLGPNGAGKSTTMNIITGYLSATTGRVLVDDMDIVDEPEMVKRKIGYLPEQPPLYGDMTVLEYLNFAGELKKVPRNQIGASRDEVCELTAITDVRKRLIRNLSKGYKQRVGLAMTLIAKPEILILDEPTVGLDPKQITDIRDLIVRLGQDRTVILSSHILPEVAATCQRILIINQGQIVADGKLDKLSMGLDGSRRLAVRLVGTAEEGKALLAPLDGVTAVRFEGNLEEGTSDFFVETAEGADVRRAVFRACALANRPLLSMRMANRSLEEIFLESTSLNREEA